MRPPHHRDWAFAGASGVTEHLGRGELVRVLYRLGRARATGVVTIQPPHAAAEILVLRRGRLMAPEVDASGRQPGQQSAARLARLASLERAGFCFDGGTAAYPPGAAQRQFSITRWARAHLEGQLDAGRAKEMVQALAGVRLVLIPALAPEPAECDETDVRILAAMRIPRRLDQIGPLARAPRFRLLAMLHFLDAVGALQGRGVAAHTPPGRPASAAHRALGLDAGADRVDIKRAYRRLARALHPDLHPTASPDRRRDLERRLAEITDAYRRLTL